MSLVICRISEDAKSCAKRKGGKASKKIEAAISHEFKAQYIKNHKHLKQP